jgi:NAD-dependent deacetylase
MPACEPSATLARRLCEPGTVLVLTGAGVSAESGLATFRGLGGLWEGHDPTALATPEAFAADPLTVWRFYDWRRKQAARAEPNAAHRALAALETVRGEVVLVTQNVDGLHERAGSRSVVRLHGSLWWLRCTREGREFEDRSLDLGALPPRCPCGALLRPAVVWFGESPPAPALERAEQAARQARVVLVVGTSSSVYPAATLPGVARAHGAYLVEINPERTPLTARVDEWLAGPAGRVMPRIAAAAGAALEPAP